MVLQNLWDLTPDTDLLKELPENYNFETALADLIVSVSVLLSKKVKCLMENSFVCVQNAVSYYKPVTVSYPCCVNYKHDIYIICLDLLMKLGFDCVRFLIYF